jgi:iron only hydrogenase large subunit-like protein
MRQQTFHHALKIQREICIGCAHCMNVCPTGALRVREGKAVLLEERCVDCGECYRACPVHAISVEQDDFNQIYNFTYSVLLIPEVLYGQFPEDINKGLINETLQQLGFNEIVEVEQAAEILKKSTKTYSRNTKQDKPLISAFCPATVRLIQVRFPSLVDHIILQKPPLNITALYYKKKLADQGMNPEHIGIFYVTQCAAKIAAVKSPVGDSHVMIDGVINLDYLYNKIYSALKGRPQYREDPSASSASALSPEGVKWSLTHGESDNCEGRCLAIDGIHHVIEILEKVEDGEMDDVDFLELRACDESCAGGILNPTNRFLTVERLRNKAKKLKNARDTGKIGSLTIIQYEKYLLENIALQPLTPRSILKLDEDMTRAIKKMRRVKDLMDTLPGVDCGVCGAPSCSALAEDIVNHHANLKDCVFIQRKYEHNRLQQAEDSYEIMKHIWGKNKLNDNH